MKKKYNRPLSPHLTIYKPQITSILSISHRITGIFQSFGLLLISTLILIIYLGENAYDLFDILLNSIFGKAFFVIYTFSLLYHLCNGIRHLLWDLGFGFSLNSVTYSGYFTIFLAFFTNVILWIYI